MTPLQDVEALVLSFEHISGQAFRTTSTFTPAPGRAGLPTAAVVDPPLAWRSPKIPKRSVLWKRW
jgi:hypothetical protein